MSTLKVDDIQSRESTDDAISLAADSSVSLKHSASAKLTTTSTGVDVTGTCTATTFSGSGASLTSLPAGNLTGTLPAIDGSNLTNVGGGSLEFVSNTLLTSDASSIQFTSLSTDTHYKIISRTYLLNNNTRPKLEIYTNGSSSVYTGNQSMTAYYGAGSKSAQAGQTSIVFDSGQIGKQFNFEMDFHTYVQYPYVRAVGMNMGDVHNLRFLIMSYIGNYLSVNNYISGLKFSSHPSETILSGTELTLYKVKQS